MPTKAKLHKHLKVMLALHGVCAMVAVFFAIGPWENRLPLFQWSFRSLIHLHIEDIDSLGQLFGLLLPILFIALFALLYQRKKGAFAFLAATVLLEVGSLTAYMLHLLCPWGVGFNEGMTGKLLFPFPFRTVGIYSSHDLLIQLILKNEPTLFLLYFAIPIVLFVATFVVTLFCLKPIKAHLEAKK